MKITNTKDQEKILNLMAAMGKNGEGIYAQERQGQQQLLASEQMPRFLENNFKKISAIETYQKLGFTFKDNGSGELMSNTEGDELFIDVILPEGWTKVGSDHDMWSYVHDNLGRKRLSVFYKAAFYDRRADVRVERRYSASYNVAYPEGKEYKDFPGDARNQLPVCGFVKDCETIIYKTSEVAESDIRKLMKLQDNLYQQAKDWLNKNYPNWEDTFAYWD